MNLSPLQRRLFMKNVRSYEDLKSEEKGQQVWTSFLYWLMIENYWEQLKICLVWIEWMIFCCYCFVCYCCFYCCCFRYCCCCFLFLYLLLSFFLVVVFIVAVFIIIVVCCCCWCYWFSSWNVSDNSVFLCY